jgi:hypothetical protein
MNQRARLVLAMLAAGGCHDSNGLHERSRPVLSRHADTVTAIGDTIRLTVNGSSSDLIWETRDKQVAFVSQTGRVSGVTKGQTWVLVFRDPGFADSTQLTVLQVVDSISVTPSSISRPLNREQLFQVTAFDAMGVPLPNALATWSVTGDAATIDGSGLAIAKAVGTATVRATVNGKSATATLTVSPLPALRFTLDTIDIGVGQYANGSTPPIRVVADSISPNESLTAALSLSDPTVATLSVPTVTIDAEYGLNASPAFQLTGLAAGIAHLTATSAQYTKATAVVRVSTPRLEVIGPSTWPANVPYRIFAVGIDDSLGIRHGVVQPLPIRVHLTTPGVLSPADTTVTMPATGGALQLPFLRGNSGQTWIVASAPGYRADSLLISVTAAKLAFTRYDGSDLATASLGAGELADGNLFVNAACCLYTDLAVSITQRHPEALQFPHSLLVPAMDQNGGRIQVQPIGLQPGTDTLIATAPGWIPDTLIYHVTTPTYRVVGYPATTSVGSGFRITAYVTDSLGTIFYPAAGSAKVLVRSSDPAVMHPSSDTLVIGNSTGGGSLGIDVIGPGTATLTLSDPFGLYAAARSAPIIVTPTKLLVRYSYPPTAAPRGVGMHQLIDAAVQIAPGGSIPDSIQLRSTDPTVVQPTVSAVPSDPNGTDFLVRGGERAGTAWIVASAPGLISDSLPVYVGRPVVSVLSQPTLGTVGESGLLSVYVLDQTGMGHATSETVTFHIVSSNPSVITADSTITVPSGEYQSGLVTVHFVGPGSAVLRIVDDRNVPYAYEPGATAIIQVSPPPPSPL